MVATGVAGLALGAPASGLGAVAAVQDDSLTVAPIADVTNRLDLVAASGARVARVDLFWSDIAPTKPVSASNPFDPAYKWDRFDQIILGLSARGITPIVSVYSSPRWAAGGKAAPKGQAWNPNFPNPAQFGLFMAAVAKRYNGTFPNGLYGTLPQVKNFEIWNEPNLQLFLRPQYKKGKPIAVVNYVKLVRAAYSRIKNANPRAVVIAGVAGPKSRTDTSGSGSLGWLQGIQASRVKFDAYSQHIYPFSSPLAKTNAFPSWSSIPKLLFELNKIKHGMPLYITEAGYTTSLTRFRKVRVSETQQRNYLKQIYNLRSVKSSRVPVIVWFNLQDNIFWPGGLLRRNGTAKPSLAAFRALSGRGSLPARLRP
jgi:hypothetical protein